MLASVRDHLTAVRPPSRARDLGEPAGADDLDESPGWGTTQPWPLPAYQPWECLGVGNRQETWLVWDTALHSSAVVKMVRPDHLHSERARAGLDREATGLAVAHAGLPRLVTDGRSDVVPHVVIEHLSGPALDATLADDGRLSDVEATLLAAGLLCALVPLHATGLAHCDVKPANVVLRDGRPVLIDLGSARRIGRCQPAGRPLGTLGYAAPEMEACAPITTAMDVYGVAATVAEARTGTAPAADRWGPAAFSRWPRRSRLRSAVEAMLSPDPAQRPDVAQSLRLVAALLPPEHGLWPLDVHHRILAGEDETGGPRTIDR